MKTYIPQPADTTGIELPEGLNELSETLARNVHEVWATGRMAGGWTFGHERNDERKTHPCIIPYEQLPESEREYDRQTAMETLKFIVSAGYKIIPNK